MTRSARWAWLALAAALAALPACSNNPPQSPPQQQAAQAASLQTAGQPESIWDDDSGATVEGQQPAPTVVGYEAGDDPLMGMNRAVFAFNDVAYRYALSPIARGWEWVVPGPVRTSIGNAFHNIRMPIRAVNHTLQGRFEGTGRNLLRFTINSTLGLGGLFDPAKAWFDLQRADTGFDDTLEQWGAGPGAYVVLPLLGPSTVRQGSASVVDYALNPIPYLTDQPEQGVLMMSDGFQSIVPALTSYGKLRQQADDPYVFFRELHLQALKRDAQAHSGDEDEPAQPEAEQ